MCINVLNGRRNIRHEHSLHMEPRPWIHFQMGTSHISVSRRKKNLNLISFGVCLFVVVVDEGGKSHGNILRSLVRDYTVVRSV